jgi:hypothetical protein
VAHARIEEVQAMLAFGIASIAVSDRAERMARGRRDGPALDPFVELEAAHGRLRIRFDHELDDDVLVLVPQVVELAERTGDAIEEEDLRPGS